jgi:hypothetical protein
MGTKHCDMNMKAAKKHLMMHHEGHEDHNRAHGGGAEVGADREPKGMIRGMERDQRKEGR